MHNECTMIVQATKASTPPPAPPQRTLSLYSAISDEKRRGEVKSAHLKFAASVCAKQTHGAKQNKSRVAMQTLTNDLKVRE